MQDHRDKTRPTIGVFSYGFAGNAIWAGAIEAAQQYDVNLIGFAGGSLHSPRGFEVQGNVLFDLVDPFLIDGLLLDSGILSHYVGTNALYEFCRRYPDIPIVSSEVALKGIPSILLDFYQGIRELIGHLIEAHGCRRIAFIRGPQESQTAEERYHAYRKALSEYDIPFDPDLIAPGTFFAPSGADAIRLLLDERQVKFDAIAAANDWMALDAMEAMRARGIQVPTDVAVVGFDDQKEAGVAIPPLTTAQLQADKRGRQGIEILLARMAGEDVAEQVILPAKLMVRESCGCSSTRVLQASVGKYAITPTPVADISIILHGQLLTEISTVFTEDDVNPAWLERLIDSFVGEIGGQTPGGFILTFKEILRQVSVAEKDLMQWHAALSILRRDLLPHLGSALSRAEDLWQQARTLLGEAVAQARTAQSMQVGRHMTTLQAIGRTLLSSFSISELMDIIYQELPQVGIPSCYLSLYVDPESPVKRSRLMLAYNEHGRIDLDSEEQLFPSRQLAPSGMFPSDRRSTMVVEALYFRERQLGFVIFEEGVENIIAKIAYLTGVPGENPLRGQISTALQGALLVQRIQENAAEIARQKYVLDTFMANVPDSIYFKDRESRIIRSNQAHATSFGLTDPGDLIGKSDFDLFPEEQARPKYEVEQEIIKTGQPLLNLEEPDAGGGWSLTTKMPLRDEHGDIIGTFGISRDITELKQTQFELHTAYQEIQILNTQLQEENLRMSAELDVARRLQEMILPPPEELQQINGLDIVGYMKPADEVGGDYYDVLKENGTIHIGIGDVTGHGLESGVLMLMTQTTIRALIEYGETDPVAFVNTLNRTIYKNVQRMGVDKTLTFSLIKYQGGQLTVVGQHEEVLVVRAGGRIERIDTVNLGFPVGLEQDIQQWVRETSVSLMPKDSVVLYTDGITEAVNLANELYGIERLCAVLSRHWEAPAEVIKHAIVEDVTRHIGEQKIYDDLTLVVLKQS